ncbi:MAG: malonate decarboxylase subunit delta [Lautropia sp.]|nr:malonate decarboxylase subunit delta [Lautropia sp.]
MEQWDMSFPAMAPVADRVIVGVVSSGDLEVMLEPHIEGETVVSITSSIDGSGGVWEALLSRMLGSGTLPAAKIEINDFGATPGVVRLRLEQAFDEVVRQGGHAR